MLYSEFELLTSNNDRLFACEWKPVKEVKGVICLIHGLGEHSGRYSQIIDYFISKGYALLAMDLRGHGRSPGKRGHISSYELVMDDIENLVSEAMKRFPGRLCYLYGHSMGGNLVLNFGLRRRSRIAGVIATSPWLKLSFPPPQKTINLIKVINKIYPSLTQSNGIKSSDLSHDSEKTKEYDSDPLVHSRISVRLFTIIHDAGLWAMNNSKKFPLPLMILHGKSDHVTSYEASEEFILGAPKYCSIKLWDGLYHELHKEPQHKEVLNYLFNWIKEVEDKQSS